MHRAARTLRAYGVLLVSCLPAASAAQSGAPSSPDAQIAVARGLFAFQSAAWVNLHHFLYVLERAEREGASARPTIAAALRDTVGLESRSALERQAWRSALAYYGAEVAGRDLVFDTALIADKARLARAGNREWLRDSGVSERLAATLERAAPVYRAVWWARHDTANRLWVAAMQPLLERYGDTLASGVTRALGVSWPTTPIPVDVAPYTNWAGAYATEAPSHIMVSSIAAGYTGSSGLEMLFHEASHTLEDSLAAARRVVAEETGKRIPYEVLHAIIFFNAGEVTRRTVPGHVPYIVSQGLVRRGSMARYFPIIERHWPARIDGRISVIDAMRAIAAEL